MNVIDAHPPTSKGISLPRYLLVQEFQDFWEDLELNRRQAKHFWPKRGLHEVKVEFFKSCAEA